MLRYGLQLLKKVFSKNWHKILGSWIWIYGYIKKYWLQTGIYTALGLFHTAFGLLSSVVSKNLIDAVTGFSTGSIGWIAAAYAGLGISRVLLNILTGWLSLHVRTKVQHEIQADVFDQIMRTDWESMSGFSTGDLLIRTNGDASAIANNVLNFLPRAANALCRFIGAFAIVCWHDPWMAVIALAGAPITFLTSRYRLEHMQKFQKESRELYGRQMTFNQETFQNIQTIKAFNLIDCFSNKLVQLQSDALNLSLRQYRYQSFSGLILSITGLAVSYACYGFAIFRLWQGDISFGTMTLFLSMSASLTSSFDSLVHLVPTAIQASVSAERIREIISLPREDCQDTSAAHRIRDKVASNGICIRAQDLSFTYQDGRTVYGPSTFEANPGEIVALVGPSGEGKTTTLRLLLGLLHPTEGNLMIGNPGGEMLPVSPGTRCLFSYVPQGMAMFSGTIAENLRLTAQDATDKQLEDALRQACAWSFVEALPQGLYTKISERGQGFSEGQNQRLSIARALLVQAPVLLLDEATSALDLDTEHQVLENIIRADPHRIIIVSAHRPSVFSMCNRAYRISEGTVTPETDLLKGGREQ